MQGWALRRFSGRKPQVLTAEFYFALVGACGGVASRLSSAAAAGRG